jgi:predicted transcriptional regulator
MLKSTTFRLEPEVKAGLSKLSEVLHLPANRLVNEALREYLDRRILAVEREMEATLDDLRAYRKRDPNFDQAIAKVAEAEANLIEDPAEGRIVSGPSQPAAEAAPAVDSTQLKMQRLLRA